MTRTRTSAVPVANGEKTDHWREQYARIPLWLCRGTDDITHAQFHILVALIGHLGGRKRWYHTSYARIAGLACTDANTTHMAMNRFVELGWVLVNGPRNWRTYKIDLAQIEADIYKPYDDEEDD